jgi:hypothetical protein
MRLGPGEYGRSFLRKAAENEEFVCEQMQGEELVVGLGSRWVDISRENYLFDGFP